MDKPGHVCARKILPGAPVKIANMES